MSVPSASDRISLLGATTPSAITTVGVVANVDRPKAVTSVKELVNVAAASGLSLIFEEQLRQELGSNASPYMSAESLADNVQCLIAFGGDGTLLRASRAVGGRNCPILGVNLGLLGFLAEIGPDQLTWAIKRLLSGEFILDPRMSLSASLDGEETRYTALNDIVIDKGGNSRIISLELRQDNEWVNTYVADGLIVATPTGSTGYSLSAGGPIMKPGVDALIATPVSPHSLTVRPMVFPSDVCLQITVTGAPEGGMRLTADGQTGCELKDGDVVRVERGDNVVLLIRFAQTSYYDLLRQKMNWGMDKTFA